MKMLRQISSRNNRSKGLKLKKALQIGLLLIVSVWLIYQVKHSFDKKKAYDETDTHAQEKDDNRSERELIKFGRRDLPARLEADSSDERLEDEENEEMEQEMRHDENDDDPIDEQDQDKDDDVGELIDQNPEKEEKDGESEEFGVFENVKREERSQEAQEKTFHGDNVASAVVHDARATEREAASREAREKSFHGDNVSSAVAHDNSDADHKESFDHGAKMDRKFEVSANLSNGITIQLLEGNKSNTDGGPVVSQTTNGLLNSTQEETHDHLEKKIDLTAANVSNSKSEIHEQVNSASLSNSTVVLNNQIQLFTNLTSSDATSASNVTSTSGSTDDQKIAVETVKSDVVNKSSSGINKVNEKEEGDHSNQHLPSNIQSEAASEGVVLE